MIHLALGFVQGFVARCVGKCPGMPENRRWTPFKPNASQFLTVIKPIPKIGDMLGGTDAMMAKMEGEIPKGNSFLSARDGP